MINKISYAIQDIYSNKPIGSIIVLPSKRTLLDIAGATYLKTGSFINNDYTSYGELLTANGSFGVWLGANVGNTETTLSNIANGSGIYQVNGRLVCVDGYNYQGSFTPWSSSAWTAPIASMGNPGINSAQAIMHGSTMVLYGQNTAYNNVLWYTSNGTSISLGVTLPAGMSNIASNGSNVIAALLSLQNTTAGSIYTSANGVTWTSRTPTGLPGNMYVIGFTYSYVLGSFILLGSNNASPSVTDTYMYTSTSGYTYNSAGSWASVAGSYILPADALNMASSTSSTIILNSDTFKVYRTTDFTSLTEVLNLKDYGIYTPIPPKYINNTYIFQYYNKLIYSTDDGLTFKVLKFASYLSSNTTTFGFANGTWGTVVGNAQPQPLGASIPTAPPYIGISANANISSSFITSNSYVRIK